MTETIAHRGASIDAPENTAVAFELAIRQGADRLELDVQLAADGAVVVHHDPTLERTTDAPTRHPDRRPWELGTFTSEELRTLDATWPAGADDARPCGVATLDEILGAFAGRTRLLLELKDPAGNPGLVDATLEVFARHPVWLDPATPDVLTVQSFDHDAVAQARRGLPDHVSYAWVFDEGVVPDVTTLPRWVRDLAVAHSVVDATLLGAAHADERRVLPWTVNDEARLRTLVELGVDGVITDVPGVLHRLVADRTTVGARGDRG